MPTIYDIARACDTSHATVSRALRNHPKVNAETRKRILAVARELGYRPDHAALALKQGKTNTLSVVLPDLANPFFAEFAQVVGQQAAAAGYAPAVAEHACDPDRERICLELALARRYDGVIAFVSRFEPLKDLLEEAWERRIPFVVPGLPHDIADDMIDGTYVDLHPGMEEAVDHLVAFGHRRIVLIADWSPQSGAGEERLEAMQSAFERHGLPYEEDSVVIHADGPELEQGYEAAKELMLQRPAPTAIIAVNDFLAAGVARGLAELGLRIPGDVSLVGSDNTWIARHWPTGLTSIDLKTQEHVSATMKILFDRLASDDWGEPRRARLETSLVVRESTGPVKKSA